MKGLWIILCALCLLPIAGCGKKEGPSSSRPAPGAEAGDPGEAERAATLARLTQTLRKYSAEKQRAPASLDELVAAGYLSELPVAPVGKKYTFDQKLQVQLVDAK